MSSKLLAVVLALAILLAGATLLVIQWTSPRGGPAPGAAVDALAVGQRLVEAGPGDITQVVISRTGAADTLVREPDGTWILAGPSAWPLDDARVTAALRLLTEARAQAPAEPGATLDAGATTIGLLLTGNRSQTVRLASTTLGGQGLAEVGALGGPRPEGGSARLAVVSDALHKTFSVGAARQWRRAQLLPRIAQEAVTLRVVSPAGGVALRKDAGRWSLVEPLGAPASASAVQDLLRALESLAITRYFDEVGGPPESVRAGVAQATTRYIITLGPGAPGTPAPPLPLELRIGPPIDAQGKSVAAALGEGAPVAIDAARLPAPREAAHYVNPPATLVRPEDVGELEVQVRGVAPGAPGTAGGAPPVKRQFARSDTSWVEVRPEGRMMQTSDRAEQIVGTLKFLSVVPADSIKIEAPPRYAPVGSIVLRSPAGAPLEELELGGAPGSALWIKRGEVYRGYAGLPPPVTALLPELVGPPSPARESGDVGK